MRKNSCVVLLRKVSVFNQQCFFSPDTFCWRHEFTFKPRVREQRLSRLDVNRVVSKCLLYNILVLAFKYINRFFSALPGKKNCFFIRKKEKDQKPRLGIPSFPPVVFLSLPFRKIEPSIAFTIRILKCTAIRKYVFCAWQLYLDWNIATLPPKSKTYFWL